MGAAVEQEVWITFMFGRGPATRRLTVACIVSHSCLNDANKLREMGAQHIVLRAYRFGDGSSPSKWAWSASVPLVP